MRRNLYLLLLVAMATAVFADPALDPFVSGNDPDYKQIADLRARFGGAAVPPGGSSRGEMVLAMAGLATDAAGEKPEGDWKTQDYDSLYSLLQKYRDELRLMGFSEKQLEDELAALKLREKELQERLDKLQPKDGMKIDGKTTDIYDDVDLTGPGQNAGTPLAYRQGIVRAELDLNMVRGIISGDVEYFMQRVLGDMYSCTTCIGTMESIKVEVRTPIAFQVGDIDTKMTPLTLWRNDDEQPFEPEPFASRREDQLEELKLEPDELRVLGVRAFTDLVLFDSTKLNLEALIVNLGLPGQTIYQRGTVPTLTGDAPSSQQLTIPYETYFGAWRAALPLGPLKVDYTGTVIADAPDSASAQFAPGSGPLQNQRLKGYDSQVHSGEVSANSTSLGLAARLEYAESMFSDPNLAPNYSSDYLMGSAMTFQSSYRSEHFGVSLTAWNVDQNFISAAAQGRTEDPEDSPLGPFPTENSTFNPSATATSPMYGGVGVPQPPESYFNGQILPPEFLETGDYTSNNGTMSVTNLRSGIAVPYDWRINSISPYGLATPNRIGARGDLDTLLFKDVLEVKAGVDFSYEKVQEGIYAPIAYTVYRGGIQVNLDTWFGWPLKLDGGYTLSDSRNGAEVAFDSTLIDVGLEWALMKNLTFELGGRHLDYNGTLPYTGTLNPQLASFGYVAIRQIYDIGGVGLKWKLGDGVSLRANYATILFDDPLAMQLGTAMQWEADQGYAELVITF